MVDREREEWWIGRRERGMVDREERERNGG